tara:strand:+ start:2039 stop:2902 length:864 start_codon:yes stop_codon:yes gene_type:complete
MSVIKNTGIKRGDKLTSTALNAEFTAVNTAFTMDADNFRTEGLDQPAFNLTATNGKSGIILKQSGSSDLIAFSGATVYVEANENAVGSSAAATQLGIFDNGGAAFIIAKQNDIFRVYWQHRHFTQAVTAKSAPYNADLSNNCWVIWLEWQLSSGGSWTQVPGQGDMVTDYTGLTGGGYGAKTQDLKATEVVYHSLDYHIGSGASNQLQKFPSARMGYGQYYYKFTSDTTIYGLRLMCKGLYDTSYAGAVHGNILRIQQAAAPTSPATVNNRIQIDNLQLSYILMKDE